MIDLNTFVDWVVSAKPGAKFEYYSGFLAEDRDAVKGRYTEAERKQMSEVANRAFAYSGHGLIHLIQKRHGVADYSYIAVRSSENYKV